MEPRFPPNVVIYVRGEVARRTQYKAQLESMVRPPKFKLVELDRHEAGQVRLKETIARLTDDIAAIVREHFPDILINENQEIIISNILAVLPDPEQVTRLSQVSARGQRA